MYKPNLRLTAAALAMAALAVACGGGNDSPAPTTTPVVVTPPVVTPPVVVVTPAAEVPASAQQTVAGLIAYLNQLISGSTTDTGEPVVVGTATIPTDDTAEPSN